jgi:formylglycine-generating enzyme required for sulfatase activity
MAYIFISYSQKDRDRVERLVNALTAEGYEVWWDLKIRSGESFDEVIERTLEKVSCVLGVWSKNAVKSEWVRAESAWAKDHGIFVSVRIDDEARLPLKFYHVHTASLADWTGSRDDPRFRRLVADIREIAGPPRSRASAPGDDLPATLPEDRLVQEPSSAPTEEPASPAEPLRPPKPEPQAAGVPAQPKPRPHGLGNWMPLLAIVALIGGAIIVSIQGKPGLDDEPVPPKIIQEPIEAPQPPGSDKGLPVPEGASVPSTVRQEQPEPTRPAVSDVSPKEVALEPQMVTIDAGEFRMGCVSGKDCSDSELPVRIVTFDEPFAMGKYEVTFAEYDRFAEATGREKPNDEGWGRGKRPVINVSWYDAKAYADWLSDQTGKRYRLPSEAEWEYATRAGSETPFSTGECIDTDQANYNGILGWQGCPETGVYRRKTLEAGSFSANTWGLHEVHGNVWEWVQDCWHDNYHGGPANGDAWEDKGGGDCQRVVRGGSWDQVPKTLRSASRGRDSADNKYKTEGFRLAQDL